MASVALNTDLAEVALHQNTNWVAIEGYNASSKSNKVAKDETETLAIPARRHLFVDSCVKEETQIPIDSNLINRFDVICRFCLNENKLLLDIFGANDCDLAMMESIVEVKMKVDDMLPKKICGHCYALLNQCVSFKRQVVSTDTALRRCIAQHRNVEIGIKKEDGGVPTPGIPEPYVFEDFEDVIEEKYTPANAMICEKATPCGGNDHAIDFSSEIKSEPLTSQSDVESLANVQNKSQKSINCQQSDKEFSCDSILQEHIKEHAVEKSKYQCSVSNKNLSRQDGLESHTSSHEISNDAEEDTNAFKCAKCKESFAVERDLFIHGSIHPEDDKIQCRHCRKDFPKLSILKRHVKIHYEAKPVKCEHCGRGFTEKGPLTKHMRLHTGEKPFICNICDKPFSSKWSLTSHLQMHTGETPYKCSYCPKSFGRTSTLNRHVRRHIDEKPFACNVCDKSFLVKCNLIQHLRVHSNEKPYKCPHCSKSFRWSSTLAMHIRLHTGEKPYKCPQCPKSFRWHSSLAIHNRTHTGELP